MMWMRWPWKGRNLPGARETKAALPAASFRSGIATCRGRSEDGRWVFDLSAEQPWSVMAGAMLSFWALENCGKPVAAAINGHCLGGGFEMALAAHARFVANDSAIRPRPASSRPILMAGLWRHPADSASGPRGKRASRVCSTARPMTG
ncbi:enoyl-CoA hydratase-related protein [Salipiger sp. 1_MG-2023]|uniref:enoyl-CoA hydratase-related protein n=1 Tax=Salipiger sp. 1_MG-2023 TaxID=3062665 RepID=UPI0034C6B852